MEYIIHEAYFPMIQNPPTDQDRTYDLLITEVSFFFPYIYRSNPAYLDTQNLTILEKKKKKSLLVRFTCSGNLNKWDSTSCMIPTMNCNILKINAEECIRVYLI